MNIEYFTTKYNGTCSINKLDEGCVTFARTMEYVDKLRDNIFNLACIIPDKFKDESFDHIPDNVRFFFSENVDYDFTLIHNGFCRLNNHKTGQRMNEHFLVVSPQTHIHSTAILDAEGLKVAYEKSGKKIQFIHTGGVTIKENTEIGPYTVVHRASMDMTEIGKGCKIGAHCNIGHNNIIGDDCVFAAGVLTSGSVTVGKNCWFGTGCIIRNGISICDDVVIGTGAVVVKDIKVPGIYAGNPAKFLKEKPEGWNF